MTIDREVSRYIIWGAGALDVLLEVDRAERLSIHCSGSAPDHEAIRASIAWDLPIDFYDYMPVPVFGFERYAVLSDGEILDLVDGSRAAASEIDKSSLTADPLSMDLSDDDLVRLTQICDLYPEIHVPAPLANFVRSRWNFLSSYGNQFTANFDLLAAVSWAGS